MLVKPQTYEPQRRKRKGDNVLLQSAYGKYDSDI